MFESRTLTGIGLSEGEAIASICLYAPEHHIKVRERFLSAESEIENEIARLESAVDEAAKDLDNWAAEVAEKIGKAESGIFIAQKYILLDSTVLTMVRNDIRKRKRNAEAAVDEVYRAYEDSFLNMENEYLRERSRDIGDIRKRLLDRLHNSSDGFVCEGRDGCKKGAGRIIVTEDFSPQMIAKTDFSTVKGFVTARGSKGSHATIMARALGIPAVSGITGIFDNISCGDTVYINGATGTVIFNPENSIVSSVERKKKGESTICNVLSLPGTETMANASLPEDVDTAMQVCADGIGLFRTEFLFIKANKAISEDEQAAIYGRIIDKMNGKPVTFRLIDAGGDKKLPFIESPSEENPFLGFRGARFLLGNMDLFKTQLRALARASRHGLLRILYPMVTDINQWRTLVDITTDQIERVPHKRENIQLGPMFEVPSVCFDAETILMEADFASIGTNDLLQYLFAVDRNNELVAHDFNQDHPILWKVLAILGDAGRKTNKTVSACGELANIPGMATRLYEVGIKSLSVSPRFIPIVRQELLDAYTNKITGKRQPI